PQRCRACPVAAAHTLRPAAARLAGHHGRGVSVVRPPLPHGHRPGQVGPVAAAGAALPQPGQESGQAVFAQPGEGADLPGRQTIAGDIQRGRTRQPPGAEDAEDGLPGPDTGYAPGTPGAGPAARTPGQRASGYLGFPPPDTTMTRNDPLSLLQSPFSDFFCAAGVSESHTRTVKSPEPDARRVPSGLPASAWTEAVWPRSSATS